MESKKIVEIFDYFTELFGDEPACELNYETDIQLLVSIILSAQCTDKRVNMVTAELFKKYKSTADFANADIKQFEKEIYSTGFYHNKAKNIIAMARDVMQNHGGKIPQDMESLIALAGVGRKTASVFMGEFYKIPAVAVDTHVTRVSHRLGLSNGKNPYQIEQDLKAIFDEKNWSRYHLYMVLFGRYYCKSQNPRCAECKLCGGACEYCK